MLQISRDQNTLKLIKSAYFSSKNKLMWTLLHTKSDGGKDYRLVVTEINYWDRTEFYLHLYSWRIIDGEVYWSKEVEKYFKNGYEIFYISATWDFMAAITDRDYIRYY